jgi:PAS domain S-box-containing protein
MENKVLIAGDNIKSIIVLRKSLEIFTSEYKVSTVNKISSLSGDKFDDPPDIIILNYDNPLEEGLSALKIIRKNRMLKNIPILMATDFLSYEVQKAISAGADDFIKKPVERVELLIRIKYLIQKDRLYRENIQQSSELRKLSLVADRSENSVLITNKEGEIEWVNKAFEKLYECTLDEFKELYGAKAGSKSKKFREAIRKCKKDLKWVVYENSWVTSSGEKKWIQTSLNPIVDEKGALTSFIAIETDITRLKLAQERLLDQNQDLIDLTVNLEQINIKLEEQKKEVTRQKKLAEEQKKLAEDLLLNIFPGEIAEQLKVKGYAIPKHYRTVSIMFTDFYEFARLSEKLSTHDLIKELSMYFEKFDSIAKAHYLEKIKTIGDAYMCAGGLPIRNRSNPIDTSLAALEIQSFIKETNLIKESNNQPKWELRLGIHTGEVIAGVIGRNKMAYDIWGTAVNTASRMETSGEINKINISGSTYKHVEKYFDCTFRGKVEVKHMGQIEMYFLNRLKKEYSEDKEGIVPNSAFRKILAGY